MISRVISWVESIAENGSPWVDYYGVGEPDYGFRPLNAAQQLAARKALQLWADVADIRFTPEAKVDRVGVTVAGSFDQNGDDHGDLLIGAPGEATNGPNAGSVYLIVGR